MWFVRLILMLAAVSFRDAVADAQPRPFRPSPSTPTPLAFLIVDGVDDPVVVAELKLTDEQKKTLAARRTELWDEDYVTPPRKLAENAADRTKATDALLKKTLTEDQYKRATQLGAQSVLGNVGFGPVLDTQPSFRLSTIAVATAKRYPELVTAFKLTEEQKKRLTDSNQPTGPGFGRAIVVSKEQSEAAKEFLGPIAKRWKSATDPRIAAIPNQPNDLSLLSAKDVRADLKLTEAQSKAIADVTEKWGKLDGSLSLKELAAQSTELKVESDKVLTSLPPAATLRLKQIAFQTNLPFTGQWGGSGPSRSADLHIDRLYTHAVVAKTVALTEDQSKEFKALWEAFEKDAASVLAAAGSSVVAEKKIGELVATRRAKADAVLTADQRAKLTALVGEPFAGTTRPDRLGPPGSAPAAPLLPLAAMREAQFGKYTTEFALLATNQSVQEELKMTPEQVTKAQAARDEIRNAHRISAPPEGTGEQYAKLQAERSKAVEEALGKLLTEEQSKRFRQIMLRACDDRSDRTSFAALSRVRSAVAYPGVAEAVKLTAEQKKKLIAGTEPDEVLTADQKIGITEMLGTPFKGDFATATTPGAFPTDNPFARSSINARRYVTFGHYTSELSELANNKAIQDELKLTPEQIKKATELRDEVAKMPLPALGPPTVEEHARANVGRSKAIGEAVAKVLDKDQAKRFREIMMQFRERGGPVSPLTATVASVVSYPGAAEAVKLTDDQRVKLITGSSPETVLTDEQKARLTKLIGAPFAGGPIGADVASPFSSPFATSTSTMFLRLMVPNKANVQEALKLTADQTKAFDEAWATYQKVFNPNTVATNPGDARELAQARSAAFAEFDKTVRALLTADQKARLAQLLLQADAAQNLVATLKAPETAKALELTKEQSAKLTELGTDATKLQVLRREYVPSDAGELKLGRQMRDAADERVMGVLTDAQKKTWKKLTGDPLPGLEKTVPPSFGGGAPGGFGGGPGGFGGGSFGPP